MSVPSLDLIIRRLRVAGTDRDGNWPLAASPPGLPRVPVRRLIAMVRCPPHAGAYEIVLDTGAPLSVLPSNLWAEKWGWRPGRDFDELLVVGIGSRLRGSVAGGSYTGRLVRARVPLDLSGPTAGPRLRLDGLIVQLADPGCGPADPLLGLWGNALDGRSLHIDRLPGSDDLAARLDF